jgi:hypothetical protein
MLRVVKKKNKHKFEWTARQLYEYHQLGMATYDNAVQRGLVWEVDKKSLFIHTLLEEGLVPPVYAAKYDGQDAYDFIDGKQRSYTVFEFKDDGFVLQNVPPVKVMQEDKSIIEEDINGKKYSELPQYMQDAIDNFSFEVCVLLNPTEEEVADTFYRLNNGKTLSAMTLSRVKTKERQKLSEIGKHELFKKALTEKGFAKYDNEMLVVKAHMLLKAEDIPGLEIKYVRPYMERMNITEEDEVLLNNVFDRILKIHNMIEDRKVAKRIITRTHLISIVPLIEKTIEDNLSEEDVADLLAEFYSGLGRGASIDKIYNAYAGAGSAKKDAVKKRLQILQESYQKYIDRKNFHAKSKMSA